ncbi:MAG: hypothetical protein A2Y38_13820 [Spirochaetes bacterium GWB1_59_5]|nr:MAG: hypothetical protein A2Y38_13820 [Spirochaetes bacterium GWB1_59_5]
MVALQNTIKRLVTYNLVGLAERSVSVTTVQQVEHPRTGVPGTKIQKQRFCGSLTFLASEIQSDLPDAILAVPEIAAAIDRGDLRNVSTPAPVRAPEIATAPLAADPKPQASATHRRGKEK